MTFNIITLGCKVNQYESQLMFEYMCEAGFVPVDDSSADITIINSCTVTSTSDSKNRKVINRTRRENENSIIALCWYSFPCNVSVNMSEGFVGEFEASQFGIEVCGNRIKSKFIQNYPLGIETEKIKSLPHHKRYIESCNISL